VYNSILFKEAIFRDGFFNVSKAEQELRLLRKPDITERYSTELLAAYGWSLSFLYFT